jgi:titin
VSLTWSAPLSSSGAKISDYVIEHSADAGTTWTRVVDRVSATTSATVTGLANGTSYLFRVAAVNATGTGAFSIASPAVTPRRLPGVPTGLVATPGDQRVSLAWNPPASDGGAAITDYVVRISGDGGATWTTVNDGVSPATSATVTGLTNGTRYVYRVNAVNAAGTGDPANDSPTFIPATFGGFSEYSAPTQIVTGSADLISAAWPTPPATASMRSTSTATSTATESSIPAATSCSSPTPRPPTDTPSMPGRSPAAGMCCTWPR